jgi:hypothetical protein
MQEKTLLLVKFNLLNPANQEHHSTNGQLSLRYEKTTFAWLLPIHLSMQDLNPQKLFMANRKLISNKLIIIFYAMK